MHSTGSRTDPDTELLNIINELSETGRFIKRIVFTSSAWCIRHNCYALQTKDPYARMAAALSNDAVARNFNIDGIQILQPLCQPRTGEQKLKSEIYLFGINPIDNSYPIQRFVNPINNLPFAVYQIEDMKTLTMIVEQNSNIILTNPFNVVKLVVKAK